MRSLMTHLGCLGALLTVLPALVGVADGSDRIEVLGNPYEGVYPSGESVYARNIWDLQASDGKLYIGAGNSSNVGPAVNAGPVPIICFDPSSGLFEKQFTVDDEQIDVYRVLDGWLYIPGHDPRESWDLGNFYRLEETGWTKHRNIPHAIHTYDMLYHQGILFAAGSGMHVAGEAAGKDWAGALVSVSRNGGATWSNVELGGFRIHNLLIVDGVVYAADVIAGPQWEKGWRQYAADSGVPNKAHANIYEFDGQGGFAARHDLGVDDIFPGAGLTEEAFARMVKPAAFGPKSVYIGALCHNDHQFIPFGLFVAGSLRKGSIDVQQIGLPPGSRPWRAGSWFPCWPALT
jgi:hypothetical protein